MPLTVTMKIFSGRPNPVWILPDSAANEFHDRITRIRSVARISNLKPAGALGGLGYRGFKVQAIGDPNSTYIHAGIVDPGRHNVTYLTDDRELEKWLFATNQKNFHRDIQDHVERSLQLSVAQEAIILQQQPPFRICPVCYAKDAPLYDQSPWWQGVETSESNNCYNYANNHITNTTAQPGKASGHLFTQENNCTDPGSVLAGAVSDGLVVSPNFSTPLAAGQGWYVALVLWPGHDFHWYRQDSNGCWSGKPGDDDVTSVDYSHNHISDPKTADRGPYTTFCSYMITRCGMKIR
jgi:hypothetical protein